MFDSNIPVRILRHPELTYQQKAFLLWCWICREDDTRCELLSCRQHCGLRERSVTWYANYFGIDRGNLSKMFDDLREKDIMKTERPGSRNEVTFIDFKIF
jgi:hypothetical protein